MSFRVTQCPACESTFNTSPAVLESAAGRVRCGACLAVFEAPENFLDTDPENPGQEAESVFLSQSPGDYFDPSNFLTRQSLRESLAQSEAVAEGKDSGSDTLPPDQDIATQSHFDSAPAPDSRAETEPVVESPAAETEQETEFMDLVASGAETEQESESGQQLLEEADFQAAAATPESAPSDQLSTATEAWTGDDEQAPVAESTLEQDEEPVPEPLDKELETELAAAAYADYEQSSQWPGQDQSIQSDAYSADTAISDTGEDFAEAAGSEAEAAETAEQAAQEITERVVPQASRPEPFPALAPPAFTAEPYRPENFRLHARFSVQTSTYVEPTPESAPPSGLDAPPEEVDDIADDLAQQEFNSALDEQDFQEAFEQQPWQDDRPDVELPDAEATAPEEAELEDLAAFTGETTEQEFDEFAAEPLSTTDEDTPAFLEQDAEATDTAADSAQEDAEDVDQSLAAIRARALQAELEDEQALESIPEENLKVLGEFSTPVEIIQGRRLQLGRRLAWTALALLAALVLAGQYLWQELPRYSQIAELRPLYEWACSMAPCELPVYNDIDAIRSSNLSVRSHPQRDDALAVNVEFRNNAAFAQEFPIMVLSFNSASNNVIALREFAPQQYLDSSLRNRRLLPPATPVQVALEIMDPGDDAVNYTLAFRRP